MPYLNIKHIFNRLLFIADFKVFTKYGHNAPKYFENIQFRISKTLIVLLISKPSQRLQNAKKNSPKTLSAENFHEQ